MQSARRFHEGIMIRNWICGCAQNKGIATDHNVHLVRCHTAVAAGSFGSTDLSLAVADPCRQLLSMQSSEYCRPKFEKVGSCDKHGVACACCITVVFATRKAQSIPARHNRKQTGMVQSCSEWQKEERPQDEVWLEDNQSHWYSLSRLADRRGSGVSLPVQSKTKIDKQDWDFAEVPWALHRRDSFSAVCSFNLYSISRMMLLFT